MRLMIGLPKSVPLRVLLGSAMILVLLPSLGVAALVLTGSIRLERHAVEEGLHVRARSLATIVDSEVKHIVSELSILSGSPDIHRDSEAFRTLAGRYLSVHADWMTLALFGGDGRLRALKGSTPTMTVEALAADARSGSSDGQFGISSRMPSGRQPVIGLSVPVHRGGAVSGAVMVVVPATMFLATASLYDTRAEALTAIIDRTGLVVAASRPTFVGRQWPYALAGEALVNGQAVVTSRLIGGQRVYTVLARVADAPWYIAYVVPARLVETPVTLSRLLLGALLLLLALPVLMTLLLGRFLVGQIRVLTVAADALAQETTPPARQPSRLREIEAVHSALEHARQVVQERGKERERLRAMQLDLERLQRLESVGQLAASIAHDFGNYLFTIRGNLELIESATTNNQRVQQLVEPALTLSHEATRLVQQLASLARRRASGVERINANEVLGEISELLRHMAGRNVKVEIRPAPRLWYCWFDPQRLQSAVVNLVANARDAMPAGGDIQIMTRNLTLTPERAAAVGAPSAGRYVALSVADTGVGMAPEVLAHAFDPFFTTKSKNGGLGIGLSVLFASVQSAGGHVTVESTVGAGTTFTILLPEGGPTPPGESPSTA